MIKYVFPLLITAVFMGCSSEESTSVTKEDSMDVHSFAQPEQARLRKYSAKKVDSLSTLSNVSVILIATRIHCFHSLFLTHAFQNCISRIYWY